MIKGAGNKEADEDSAKWKTKARRTRISEITKTNANNQGMQFGQYQAFRSWSIVANRSFWLGNSSIGDEVDGCCWLLLHWDWCKINRTCLLFGQFAGDPKQLKHGFMFHW